MTNLQEPFIDRVIKTALFKIEEIKSEASKERSSKKFSFFHLKTEDEIILYKRTKNTICEKTQQIFGEQCHVYLSLKTKIVCRVEKSRFALDEDSCHVREIYKPYISVNWDGVEKEDEQIIQAKDKGTFHRDKGYWSP